MKTMVPAGASSFSSPSVNVARPFRTRYISSWRSDDSVCSSTTSSPAFGATYALIPNAPTSSARRTGRQSRVPFTTEIGSISSRRTLCQLSVTSGI